MLRSAPELEKVGVEWWHFWGDVVEQKCLDQVRPVDLEGYLFEEVVNIQVVLTDHINDQFVFHWHLGVKFQCTDGTRRQTEALEWVQAIL